MLPQGMFSVAIATVLFPTLLLYASRGDMRGFAEAVSNGIRQIAFLLAPAAIVRTRGQREPSSREQNNVLLSRSRRG